jgi:hypothetical protein
VLALPVGGHDIAFIYELICQESCACLKRLNLTSLRDLGNPVFKGKQNTDRKMAKSVPSEV